MGSSRTAFSIVTSHRSARNLWFSEGFRDIFGSVRRSEISLVLVKGSEICLV